MIPHPTPAQDMTAGLILLTATLWAAFGYGVWRLLRGAQTPVSVGTANAGPPRHPIRTQTHQETP